MYAGTCGANVDDAGIGAASVNVDESVIIDARCKYKLTMQLPDAAGENTSVLIDSVVFVSDYKRSRAYTHAGRSNWRVC